MSTGLTSSRFPVCGGSPARHIYQDGKYSLITITVAQYVHPSSGEAARGSLHEGAPLSLGVCVAPRVLLVNQATDLEKTSFDAAKKEQFEF